MTTMTPPTGRATNPAALYLTRNYDWRDDAACKGRDDDLFFPVGTRGPAALQIEEAKSVCRGCPVITECRDWAIATEQHVGVWGGLSEEDRRQMVVGGQYAFVRCLESQEFIEEQRKQGVGVRQLARLVGVSYEVMRRAVRYLDEERAAQGEEVAA